MSLSKDLAVILSLSKDVAAILSLSKDLAVILSLSKDVGVILSLSKDVSVIASLSKDVAVIVSLSKDEGRGQNKKDEAPRRLVFTGDVQLRFGGCRLLCVAGGLTLRGVQLLLLCGSGALVKLIYPPGRVDEFLLARKERVAGGANLDRDLLERRAGREGRAARAVHAGFGIPGWMNLLFHSHSIIAGGARGPTCVGPPLV